MQRKKKLFVTLWNELFVVSVDYIVLSDEFYSVMVNL